MAPYVYIVQTRAAGGYYRFFGYFCDVEGRFVRLFGNMYDDGTSELTAVRIPSDISLEQILSDIDYRVAKYGYNWIEIPLTFEYIA